MISSMSGILIEAFRYGSSKPNNYCPFKCSVLSHPCHREDTLSLPTLYPTCRPRVIQWCHYHAISISWYQKYREICAIVHTHSIYATAWAQSCRSVPCLGTTHADFCIREIPVTDLMSKEKVEKNYELNTANSIINKLNKLKLKPLFTPGILVANHGPFAWGKNLDEAIRNAEIIEFIARLAFITLNINNKTKTISKHLHAKHFYRKHGPNSYYGQKNKE